MDPRRKQAPAMADDATHLPDPPISIYYTEIYNSNKAKSFKSLN